MHLNTFCFSMLVAEHMKKKNQRFNNKFWFNLWYCFSDKSIYKNTNMLENTVWSNQRWNNNFTKLLSTNYIKYGISRILYRQVVFMKKMSKNLF